MSDAFSKMQGAVARYLWAELGDHGKRDKLTEINTTAMRNLGRVALECVAIEQFWITLDYQEARKHMTTEGGALIRDAYKALADHVGDNVCDVHVLREILNNLARLQVAATARRAPDRGRRS